MEIDAIDALSDPVVGAQLGQAAVRLPGQFLHARRADGAAGFVQAHLPFVGAESVHDRSQNFVGAEGVVVRERRRLIKHLVRGVTEGIPTLQTWASFPA